MFTGGFFDDVFFGISHGLFGWSRYHCITLAGGKPPWTMNEWKNTTVGMLFFSLSECGSHTSSAWPTLWQCRSSHDVAQQCAFEIQKTHGTRVDCGGHFSCHWHRLFWVGNCPTAWIVFMSFRRFYMFSRRIWFWERHLPYYLSTTNLHMIYLSLLITGLFLHINMICMCEKYTYVRYRLMFMLL